jgi:putative oxidoreductase
MGGQPGQRREERLMAETGDRHGSVVAAYGRLTDAAKRCLTPFLLLGVRVLLGFTFFVSGTLKLPKGFLGVGKGDWSSTLALFESEYRVPLLSASVAAYAATATEIVAPLLLWIGLGARFAAAALCVMALVIELTYVHDWQHFYWLAAGCLILIQGAGAFSADYLIKTRCFS